MSAPQHTLAPSRSHARPSRLRRLFPVRKRGSAIADAIEAARREAPPAIPAPEPPARASVVRMPVPFGPTGDIHLVLPAPVAEAAPDPFPPFTGAALESPPEPAPFPPVSGFSSDAETLRRASAALRAWSPAGPESDEDGGEPDPAAALPGACLRAIMPPTAGYPGGHYPHEPLTGRPDFAGTAYTSDGRFAAGLYLGDEDADGRIVIDVMDPAWLRDCIGSALQALCALAGAWSVGINEPALATLAAALRDGIDYRMSTALDCRDCDKAAEGLCPDHAEDDRQAARYQKMLGLLVPAGRDVAGTARLRPVPAAADGGA